MGQIRKCLSVLMVVAGSLATVFGIIQTGRVSWAMLHPPAGVFEPLVPLGAGIAGLLVGLLLVALGRFIWPVVRYDAR